MGELQDLVSEQAADDGLWFIAETAPEAYLQQELRRLHASIEQVVEINAEPLTREALSTIRFWAITELGTERGHIAHYSIDRFVSKMADFLSLNLVTLNRERAESSETLSAEWNEAYRAGRAAGITAMMDSQQVAPLPIDPERAENADGERLALVRNYVQSNINAWSEARGYADICQKILNMIDGRPVLALRLAGKGTT